MRTIIAGSRGITDMEQLEIAIASCEWEVTTVISGAARGVDALGEEWARRNEIPCEKHPADWDQYGKRAGYIRNQQMSDTAEALIVLWDGKSKGTKHMIDIAVSDFLHIYIHYVWNFKGEQK